MSGVLFPFVSRQKPAIIMAGSREIVTFGELRDSAWRLARWFRSVGLQQGDHVALCLENQAASMGIVWGAHAAGLAYTPISTRSAVPDAAYVINDCGAKVVISSSTMGSLAADLVGACPDVDRWLAVGGAVAGHDDFDSATRTMPALPIPDAVAGRDRCRIASGTTGRPKGVLVQLPPQPVGGPTPVVRRFTSLFGFDESTVYLSPAPLYHAAPLRSTMAVQYLGGTVVLLETFDPELALAAIDRYQVTASQWVPTMLSRMLKLPAEVRERYDLSSMLTAIHAAAPCSVALKEQMFEWWGPILHEYYAGTEGNGFTHCGPDEWLADKGSVGKPVGCGVHVVDDQGSEVQTGDEGVVYFSGGTFEYHNDPAKTTESRHPMGWSTLGDIGHIDQDGFLYLTDRKANTIVTGGVNVYPQEVENLLEMHPAVADVAVFGVPNSDFGEEVKAVVQPVRWSQAGPTLEGELIHYCRQNLADVKCPRSVDFEAELPRQPTGKLFKRLLRDPYWVGHQSRLV